VGLYRKLKPCIQDLIKIQVTEEELDEAGKIRQRITKWAKSETSGSAPNLQRNKMGTVPWPLLI
jgi:hypothetical protein